MKELIDIIFNSSKERVKNPLIGSFVLALIGFNWKAIFILLFSDSPAVEKINLISEDYSSISSTVLAPLFFATFYVAGLPYVMWFFDWISGKSWRGRKTHLSEQKIFEIQSEKEVTRQKNELENAIAKQQDTQELNNRIKDLSGKLRESEEENGKLKKAINELKAKLNHETFYELSNADKAKYDKDYSKFKDSKLFNYFYELGLSMGNDNGLPYMMDDLIKQKFIYLRLIEVIPGKTNSAGNFRFTRKGHYFWEKYLYAASINDEETSSADDDETSFNEDRSDSDGLPF